MDFGVRKIASVLADGDITKLNEIMYSVRISEIDEFLEIQSEKIMFRKAVLAFMGAGQKKETGETEEEYLKSIENLKAEMKP